MDVIRVKKNQNYTTVSNFGLRDKRLSWGAKGFLVYMLSLPPNWEAKVEHLKTVSTDGRDSTNTKIKELMKFGYITRKETEKMKGQFQSYDYTVIEKPTVTGFPLRTDRNGETVTENPVLLSTEGKSTEEVSTYKEKKIKDTSKNNDVSENLPLESSNRKKEDKDPKKKRVIPEKIVGDIEELIKIGGFPNHKLPGPDEEPTAVAIKIYDAMLSFRSGRYCRDYPMDAGWIERNKIDKGKLVKPDDWDGLMAVMRRAVRGFHRMKTDPGYWPAEKKYLGRVGLDAFFYNVKNQNSWFLYCATKRPQKLREAIDNKNTMTLQSKFTEGEQKVAGSIMRENWNPYGFWQRISELQNWYNQNIKMLRRVHSHTICTSTSLGSWMGSFKSFLDQYREFALTWDSFYVSNVGPRNGTWKYFVEYMFKEHQIILEPTQGDIKLTERYLTRS